MRRVSSATCTSGEPVSLSWTRKSLMIFAFASLVWVKASSPGLAVRALAQAPSAAKGKALAHGLREAGSGVGCCLHLCGCLGVGRLAGRTVVNSLRLADLRPGGQQRPGTYLKTTFGCT